MTMLRISLVSLILLTTACAQASTPASARPGSGQSALGGPAGKPAAAVDIRFITSGQAEAGVLLAVEVQITPSSATDSLQLELTGLEGLAVVGGDQLLQLDAAAGQTQSRRLLVLPSAAGGLLRATAISRSGGNERRKVAVLPVQVSGGAQTKQTHVETTPTGEKIINLPAEESTQPP